MKIWLDGGLRDADDRPRLRVRPRADRRRRHLRDRQGHRRPALRAAPGTWTGWPAPRAGLGLPEPDLDEVRRACDAVLDANPMPLGRLRITYTGGLSPLGSDRGDDGPDPGRRRSARPTRRPDTTAVITVPGRATSAAPWPA